MFVLSLVCPDPSGPDPMPVVIGTNANANHAKWLAQLWMVRVDYLRAMLYRDTDLVQRKKAESFYKKRMVKLAVLNGKAQGLQNSLQETNV